MKLVKFPIKKRRVILALGAESAGVFAVYRSGSIFISENFGDLLEEGNFLKYKKAVFDYLKKENFSPDTIITDLHPLFKTTIFGEELAKSIKAKSVKVQHHVAHIFSAVGDKLLLTTHYSLPTAFYGLAMDGTGYGLDGNIWGGEIFKMTNDKFPMTNQFQNPKSKTKKNKNNFNIERAGSLEEQIMIGGDLAVKEPARILISILSKFLSKKEVYRYIKKYYSRNEFELLYNQLEQNFNCQRTTSTGRILDAVSVLLGFAVNERNYKHEATKKLEENSTVPYSPEPKIYFSVIASEAKQSHTDIISQRLLRCSAPRNDKRWILQTTPLFEYLIKNIHKDKRRLAATAQLYIARGLYEIIKKNHKSLIVNHKSDFFAAGGLTNNKIISFYLEKHGVYLSKKIPKGDEGAAVGQVFYYLLNE